MLVSGLVLALYFWVFFAGIGEVSSALLVSDIAAILAGSAFVFSFITYLWVPKKHLPPVTFINYLILIAVVATLIAGTDYLSSPFIALWILVSVFAPLFNWLGVSIIVLVTGAYITQSALSGTLVVKDLLTLLLVAAVPLSIGLIIQAQLHKTAGRRRGESAYSQLASELSAVEGKSEVVIAAIADGVLALDKSGNVELINPAAQKMIGWGKADAIGLNYKSVLKLYNNRDKPPEPANDPIYQALSTNQTIHSETMSLATFDANKKFLAAITASPVGEDSSGVIVVFRDITREKAEEREQAEFISTASHEMRTPVASIEGYLGLALNPRTAQIDEKARDFIGKAQASAQHLGHLFQDLLDVSRVDDNRLNSNPKIVDLVELTHSIAQGLLAQAQTKGLRINYKPKPDLGDEPNETINERTLTPIYYVELDNDHLREVISNLIENAIKYTPSGAIDIDIVGDGDHVTLSVADSGIGIPQEDIPHLFQKFYRVDDSDTREIGGTGLGLYLARKLVESMHGKIWVDSQYQQGSTFYIQLPRLDNAEAKRKLESITHTPTPQTPITPPAPIAPTISQQPIAAAPAPAPDPASINPATQQAATQPTPQEPPQPAAPPIAQPPTSPTPRPTIAQMSPRPVAPQATPRAAAQPAPATTRQNIPISTLEQQSHNYVRARNTPPTSQPQ